MRTADSGINFAGLSAADAVTLATDTAGNDPLVQTALQMQLCTGDCNGDGVITIDEVVSGINIALGVTPLSQCSGLDANGDGLVTVDELLGAVSRALNGC